MGIGKGASSTDILRWDFSGRGEKSYVLNLSENGRRSLEYKRRNGEWGGKAPLGYLNQRDANNKSTLIHDPERAFLVRMLFEEYAKGCLSISGDLVRMAREWGLRNKTRKGGTLSPRQIQHILMNPFSHWVAATDSNAAGSRLTMPRGQLKSSARPLGAASGSPFGGALVTDAPVAGTGVEPPPGFCRAMRVP